MLPLILEFEYWRVGTFFCQLVKGSYLLGNCQGLKVIYILPKDLIIFKLLMNIPNYFSLSNMKLTSTRLTTQIKFLGCTNYLPRFYFQGLSVPIFRDYLSWFNYSHEFLCSRLPNCLPYQSPTSPILTGGQWIPSHTTLCNGRRLQG